MTYMWATELNNLYVSYLVQQPKLSATRAANQGLPLALQVGIDGWKTYIILFPYLVEFSH